MLQPYGLLHGGVLCSIVETLGSVGGAVWFGDRGHVVGTSNHTNFLRAVREGDVLTAVATPVHRGRTQQLWTVDVRDEQDRLVAKGELRVANLAKQRPDACDPGGLSPQRATRVRQPASATAPAASAPPSATRKAVRAPAPSATAPEARSRRRRRRRGRS